MFEMCEVEASFRPNGLPRPTYLTWKDQKLTVVDYGRHWQDDDGWHLLIRVADGTVFELLYNGFRWHGCSASHRPSNRNFL